MGRVCAEPGCPDLAIDRRHCEAHKRAPWQGSTRERSRRPWDRTRRRIFQRDRGLCQLCKAAERATRATEVDHIVSLAQGGTDEDSNLQSVCSSCHRAKTLREAADARWGADWAGGRGSQV